MTTTYNHTNTTSNWQLVGNAQEVISEHATPEAAKAALDAMPEDLGETAWAVAKIVAPGQSTSCTLDAGLTEEEKNAGGDWIKQIMG